MPEAGKATAQLAAEVAHVRKVRPDLPLVADAEPWTFLEGLRPDERAGGFACEHLSEVAAVATDWKYRAILRDDEKGRSSGRSVISATRRQDRRSRFSIGSLHSSERTDTACATQA